MTLRVHTQDHDDAEWVYKWSGVASELGVSQRTIINWCNRAGVEPSKMTTGRKSTIQIGRGHVQLLLLTLLLHEDTNRVVANYLMRQIKHRQPTASVSLD